MRSHSMYDEDSIPLFSAGLTMSFDAVVHKQVITKCSIGTATSDKGGERITRSGWGGTHEEGKLQRR